MRGVVEQLAAGGEAVARTSEGVVFVRGAAPGDVVDIHNTERIRGALRATDWSLVEAGGARVVPPCPWFGRCGGCQWQHVAYEDQVREKEQLLRRALHMARLEPDVVCGVRPAPEPLGWRVRGKFYWRAGDDGLEIGFLGPRSHRLVDVTQQPGCLQVTQAIREAVARFRGLLARLAAEQNDWRWGRLYLLEGEGGGLHAALHGGGPTEPRRDWVGDLPEIALEFVAGWDRLEGLGFWTEEGWAWIGNRAILYDAQGPILGSAGAFAQANRMVNRLVRGSAAAGVLEGGPILELHAGSGNLTCELLRKGPVTAVELDPEAVALLLEARREWSGRVKVKRADAARFVERALIRRQEWTTVVLDPPRSGCRNLMEPLAALGPRRVVYVSCDIATAARDIAILERSGYRTLSVEAFDTMPQTSHFETVLVADRM